MPIRFKSGIVVPPSVLQRGHFVVRSRLPGLTNLLPLDGYDNITSTWARDRINPSNYGTLVNGPVQVPGKIGQALSFNGSNQYVFGVMGQNPAGPPFTICAWINWFSGTCPLSFLNTGNNWDGWYITTGPWKLNCAVGGSSFAPGSTGSASVAGVWTHIVGVVASATSRLIYVNGVPGTLDTASFSPAAGNQGLGLGAAVHAGPDNFSQCYVDDVRLYNRALSQAEILSLYNNPAGDYVYDADRLPVIALPAVAGTQAQLTQIAAEQWASGTTNQAQITQIGVEQWAAVGVSPSQVVVTQIGVEHWASVVGGTVPHTGNYTYGISGTRAGLSGIVLDQSTKTYAIPMPAVIGESGTPPPALPSAQGARVWVMA